MHWAETPIHFIDFEGNRTSGILEFGVVTMQHGEIVNTRSRLCGAIGRIAPEDVAVHGLDATRVAGRAMFQEEWEYFAALRETGPLAAHFAQAENSLIKSVWPYPRTAPDFARPGKAAGEWGAWIDTGRLYPQFFPHYGDGKLEQLIGQLQLQIALDELAGRHCPPDRRGYHAALYDALAGALLLLSLLRRPEFAQATVPWLLQMSTLDPARRGAMQQTDLF